jgi:hypothetical protein
MRDGTPARERQFRPQIVRKGQTRLKGSRPCCEITVQAIPCLPAAGNDTWPGP